MSKGLLVCGLLATGVALGGAIRAAETQTLPPAEEALTEEGAALVATDAYEQDQVVADLAATPDSFDLLTLLRRLGLRVFTTPFNPFDGYGDGDYDSSEYPPLVPGHRPTLQGNGLSLRVNGLDAQSCNACHSIVSHRAMPPVLGFGGVGGIAQNVIARPSLIDVGDSFDLEDRIEYMAGHDPDLLLDPDGEADYNGRYINAPFLFGGGGVELLAKEMTDELQSIFLDAVTHHGSITPLTSKDVNFGYVAVSDSGEIDLHLVGIGPLELPDTQDPQELRKVIVVRPFGRKGDRFSMRDFDVGAMQFHFGMQPVEAEGVGWFNDEDGDHVVNEVTPVEMTFLHVFSVLNPRPTQEPLDLQAQIGYDRFRHIGCSDCHREMETDRRRVPLSFPETAWEPFEDVYAWLDLTTVAGFDPIPGGGVEVHLFSDLKRHDMGDELAEDLEDFEGVEPLEVTISNREFITARLWGVADTAPYLHDGRAATLREAIEMHGGEAEGAKEAFAALSTTDQRRLIRFLKHLRTPEAPNEDLLPL